MPIGGSNSGGGVRPGDVRAGGAYVEVGIRDRFSQALAAARKKFEGFGKLSVKAGLGLFGAGATGAAGVAKLFESFLDRGNEFQTLAERFGASTEELSSLAYAFEAAGVPVEQFGDSIKGLEKKLSAAADGQDETFRRLGLNARQLMALPLGQQFDAVADALAAVENPADQARIAMELFEESGLKLLPTLKKGKAGLAEMAAEARNVGAVLDSDAAKKSQEVGRSFTRAWSGIKYAALEVGAALLDNGEVIQRVASWIVNVAKSGREWINDNRRLVSILAAVTVGVAAAGAGLIGLGTALSLASTAGGAVATAAGAIASAFGLILTPAGAVIAILAGITAAWVLLTDSGGAWFQRMRDGFGELIQTAKLAGEGIMAALSMGDLRKAGEIALKGFELELAKAQARILENWNNFKGFFVDAFHDGVKLLKLAWIDFDEWFGGVILDMAKALNTHFGEAFRKLVSWLSSLATALGDTSFAKSLDAIAAMSTDTLNAALDGVKQQDKAKHDQERNQVEKDASAAQDERNAFREADLTQSRGLIAQLGAELAALVADAKAEAAKPKPPGAPQAAAPRLPNLASLASEIKGGFTAPFLARQFGVGDTVQKRQLAAAEAAVNVQKKELPAINAGIQGLAESLVFGP